MFYYKKENEIYKIQEEKPLLLIRQQDIKFNGYKMITQLLERPPIG